MDLLFVTPSAQPLDPIHMRAEDSEEDGAEEGEAQMMAAEGAELGWEDGDQMVVVGLDLEATK